MYIQNSIPMKIQIYIASIIILLIASCSEEEIEPKFLNVDNFSITIPNNPIEGKVLGAISATTNQTNLAYTISSQKLHYNTKSQIA